MSGLSKKVIFGSIGAAGLVGVLAIVDVIIGFPFKGQMTMDILFLLAAAAIGYMAYDAYQDLK